MLSIGLVIWSVAFPVGMFALYYIVFKKLYNKNRDTIEGRADTLLEPVNEK
jgi:hypothetical protein